jgi:DNA-binding LacI/PurR family transcriptional regulator
MKAKRRKPVEKTSERMDIRTIARAANVSIATVSPTMNRVTAVNPRMANRVWEVINEFGYFPNTQARSLVSGRSRIFGLIVRKSPTPSFRG